MNHLTKKLFLLVTLCLNFAGAIVVKAEDRALIAAVLSNDIQKTRALIDSGKDVNGAIRDGITPLAAAAIKGFDGIAELLISKGANPSIVIGTDSRRAPLLHLLIDDNKEQMIGLLIRSGYDLNLRNADGQTALHEAATENNLNLLKLIVAASECIDPQDNRGATPLHWAALFGYTEIINYLVENGANLRAIANDGKTPLSLAMQRDQQEAVALIKQLLQSQSADNSASIKNICK